MMFCSACGTKLREDFVFCCNCGVELNKTVPDNESPNTVNYQIRKPVVNQPPSILKPGGFLSGNKFEINNNTFKYTGVYGKFSTVPLNSIKSVTLSPGGWGKVLLNIIGEGTTLASIELPRNWAEKAMDWIFDELRARGKNI